jgi:hypothetical protein
MPLGIQRMPDGSEASVITPAHSSARLHSAIAWTVPIWLWTRRRSAMVASQRPGSSRVMVGRIDPKYGAFRHTTRLNSQLPNGRRSNFR